MTHIDSKSQGARNQAMVNTKTNDSQLTTYRMLQNQLVNVSSQPNQFQYSTLQQQTQQDVNMSMNASQLNASCMKQSQSSKYRQVLVQNDKLHFEF